MFNRLREWWSTLHRDSPSGTVPAAYVDTTAETDISCTPDGRNNTQTQINLDNASQEIIAAAGGQPESDWEWFAEFGHPDDIRAALTEHRTTPGGTIPEAYVGKIAAVVARLDAEREAEETGQASVEEWLAGQESVSTPPWEKHTSDAAEIAPGELPAEEHRELWYDVEQQSDTWSPRFSINVHDAGAAGPFPWLSGPGGSTSQSVDTTLDHINVVLADNAAATSIQADATGETLRLDMIDSHIDSCNEEVSDCDVCSEQIDFVENQWDAVGPTTNEPAAVGTDPWRAPAVEPVDPARRPAPSVDDTVARIGEAIADEVPSTARKIDRTSTTVDDSRSDVDPADEFGLPGAPGGWDYDGDWDTSHPRDNVPETDWVEQARVAVNQLTAQRLAEEQVAEVQRQQCQQWCDTDRASDAVDSFECSRGGEL